MSIHALSWALKLDIPRSSEKFVLVCLCNYADEQGFCYPSVATLERDTAQDRKTVISNLKSLSESGYLHDTGRRVGATGGVIVYQVVGIPDVCSTHYVYRLTNLDTGHFYIGKRSCVGSAESDSYRGSGRWTREMSSAGVSLHREVIGLFETSESALAEEQRLFREFDQDPLCMNDGLPSKQRQRNSPKNGTYPKNGTVPKTDASSPVFPTKQSRFSAEAVPKTVHRTIIEPSVEPPRNRQQDIPPAAEVVRVFDHWKLAHRHPKAKLDPKRVKLIKAALQSYSEADLCESITGYLNSPFHMGKNDRDTVFDDIELFLRGSKQIDAGIRHGRDPPQTTNLSKLSRENLNRVADWMPPEMRNAAK